MLNNGISIINMGKKTRQIVLLQKKQHNKQQNVCTILCTAT